MRRIKKRRKRPAKKYSAIFVEYAAPLLELASDFDEFNKAVEVAKLGWNIALFHRAGQFSIEEALAVLGEADGDDAAAMFDMLAERRLGEFGHYDWTVDVDQVRDEGDEWVVRVEARELPQ